jgi:hypothetical protein
MNVEIGAEAALFPEKEYIMGIFVAVCYPSNVKKTIWARLVTYPLLLFPCFF